MSTSDFDFEPPVNPGLYTKFEPGKQYIVRIAGPTIIFNNDYNGQLSEKYAWKIWNDTDKVAQVMQMGVVVYRMIRTLAKDNDYGDPRNYNLKITRTGEKLETKYEVIASPFKIPLAEVDEHAQAELDKLNDLEVVSKGKGVTNAEYLNANTVREAIAAPANVDSAGPGPDDKLKDDGQW